MISVSQDTTLVQRKDSYFITFELECFCNLRMLVVCSACGYVRLITLNKLFGGEGEIAIQHC